MPVIGGQDGITWLQQFLDKYQAWAVAFANWTRLPDSVRHDTAPPLPPTIPPRGPNYDAANMTTWPPDEKLIRTLRSLREDHDNAIVDPPPPPPPPPPPTYTKVAPRVANKQGGSDARFCMFLVDGSLRPGVAARGDGKYTDETGAIYTADGLEETGRRSPDLQVEGLVGAREIDGRPICSLPMVGQADKNSGSWAI